MNTTSITLGWPPKALSPNARTNWAARARIVKAYRQACAWQALEQTTPEQREALRSADRLRVHLTFVPPDRRLRDADNCIAAAKAGLDGLADALGVNDRRFVLSSELLTNGEIGGVVRVRVLQAAAVDVEGGVA